MMNREHDRNEQLLGSLLRQLELGEDAIPPAEHPDEETLALFAAGGLLPAEREALLNHLEACSSCREVVSLVWKETEESEPVSLNERRTHRINFRLVGMALAASLLLVVGFLLWNSGQGNGVAERKLFDETRQLLAQGDFTTARERLEQAAAEGIESDRLRNLQFQATLELPHEVALNSAGRLPEFGYGIGGVAARSADDDAQRKKLQQALAVVEDLDTESPEILLNKGYALLALNRSEAARQVFELLAKRESKLPTAWLGLGIAQFAAQDFAAAETSFNNSLELDPNQIAAQLNLAMTLEELGKLQEALAAWQRLPLAKLAPGEQQQVQQEIEELKQHLNR